MLINEVIATEGQSYVLNGIEEIIVRAKARGLTKLSTKTVLAKLDSAGYFVTMPDLVKMLNRIDAVGSANKEEVTLDTALPDSPDPKDDTVSKMAANQIKKGMK
jgi:hypothetical protein